MLLFKLIKTLLYFNNTLGCIMNSMVEDLIIKVISVEDIPADDATELVTLFNLIVKRAPIIFPVSLYR